MPHYICDAIVTSKVTCTIEADTLEEARAKAKCGDWDEYDEDGGEVQSVECDLKTVRPDPAFED